MERFVCEHGKRFPFAAQICTLIVESVEDLESCHRKLLELESILREEDVRSGIRAYKYRGVRDELSHFAAATVTVRPTLTILHNNIIVISTPCVS